MKALRGFTLAVGLVIAMPAFAGGGCRVPTDDVKEDHTHCGASSAPGAVHGAVYKATGRVRSVDRTAAQVVIAHDPVPALKWPAMTMRFGLSDRALLEELAAGKRVDFRFVQRGENWIVTALY